VTDRDRTSLLAWAPGSGTLLVSTIVGLLAFVAMLLYGPPPQRPPQPTPTVDQVRPWVRGNVLNAIGRGDDLRAVNELLEHLKTDPGFGWGWRIVYQLASRDESLAEERRLAADRLGELTRGETYDEEWPWDRRTRGLAHMIAGRTDEARATLARGIGRTRSSPGMTAGLASFLESAMLAIGDQPEEALVALRRAVEEENYLNSNWLLTTPDLDTLRNAPRLDAIIARSQELERAPPPEDPDDRPDGEPDEGPDEEPGGGSEGGADDLSGG